MFGACATCTATYVTGILLLVRASRTFASVFSGELCFLKYEDLSEKFTCINQRSYSQNSTSDRSSSISSVEMSYIRNKELDFANTATARVRWYLRQRFQIAVQRNAHFLRGCTYVCKLCSHLHLFLI